MARFRLLAYSLLCLAATAVNADGELWEEVQSTQSLQLFSSGAVQARAATAAERRYRVNEPELRAILQRVSAIAGPGSQQVIRLPMPDGGMADFEIYESPVMDDELARKYPDIRTFKVYGIDDPLASGRLDITPLGFHAMLSTSRGRLFLDPHDIASQPELYDARTHDAELSGHSCSVVGMDVPDRSSTDAGEARVAARSSSKLFQYRLAVSATEDYVDTIFNPILALSRRDQAQSAIATAINRVNEIYERDLGVFFKLVNGNETLIDVDGSGGLANDNTQLLFDQNQAWIDTQLGNSRYDVGHAFSTGGGGLGWLGGACDDANKARGVSGISNPTGDPFYIDFVAHEIGHQFNADHSFNGSTQSCGNALNASTAYEPGSGSTIMAYAGICGVEDLQSNSDATFHAGSIMQINKFIKGAGACYRKKDAVPANPNHPMVSSLNNKAIPSNTPFVLKAVASDVDGDTLSYQWDQMDTGCSTDASSFGTDLGNNPLFRSFEPRDELAERHFPSLGTQLEGLYDDAEVLPCHERDLNFRVTVRDGRSGLDAANVKLNVVDQNGKFRVRSFNSPGVVVGNLAPFMVEWNVARTDRTPVNCANVDIELMTLAKVGPTYTTYSLHPLAMMTPNDGNEMITPVADSHPRARIRVKCSNNYFYDISDADFAITGTGAGTFGDSANDVIYNANGTTGTSAPKCPKVALCGPAETTNLFEGSGRGSSAIDYRWLLLLAGLVLLVRTVRRTRA